MKKLILSIDFDGCIVSEKYPRIGKLKRGAKETINKLFLEGHYIIINSCRAGKYEKEMEDFLRENEINFHKINRNLNFRIAQFKNDCRKIGADIYIDDKNKGSRIINWNEIYDYVKRRANAKPLIFAIIGESGTGKTTAAKYIEDEHSIPMILSYTTRPKRYPNETGHTFITKEDYKKYKKEDFIAYTEFGGHHYFCLKEDVKDLNSYVIDEKGYRMLLNNPDIEVIGVRIKRQHKEGISTSRQNRDIGQFAMPNSKFDYILYNDLDKNYLIDEIDKILKKTLENF